MTGKVQSWSDERGFGFIVDSKKRVIFCHWCEIEGEGFKSLRAGQKVSFNLYETDQGFEARGIKKL